MIKLTETEEKIVELIVGYSKTLNPPVIPRIAGGWVRDKMLGIDSDDIDIVLDRMSGINFATGLVNYGCIDHQVHKIKANPDKSKHLETAVVCIYGLNVDFVHLRTECYGDSRIPTIKIGTAEEDAYRRDITINSLFYNLFTKEIEDFTGRGIDDLKNKRIVTPLDPNKTLLDDPLRILRIFRFHAKFGFTIDSVFYKAIERSEIKDAFYNKVSFDRVWAEMYKMLKYKNGHYGLLDLSNRNFIEPIFKSDIKIQNYKENINNFIKRIENSLYGSKIDDNVVLLRLFIILQIYCGNKTGKTFLTEDILRDNLKAPRWFVKGANRIENNLITLKQANLSECNLKTVVPIVLSLGLFWRESITIFYAMNNNFNFEELMVFISDNKIEDKCFNTIFKVNGNDLVGKLDNIKLMPQVLNECKILEILNSEMQKDEIIKIALLKFK